MGKNLNSLDFFLFPMFSIHIEVLETILTVTIPTFFPRNTFLILSNFWEKKRLNIDIFPFLDVTLYKMAINITFLYFWVNQWQHITCKTFVQLNLVVCFIPSPPKFLDLELHNVTFWSKKFFLATINSSSHKQVWWVY